MSSSSLAGRATLALALMFGFYALALLIVGGLVAVIWLDVAYGGRVHPKLVLGCAIAAGAVIWAVLPRPDRFHPPGPRLTDERQPRLFAQLREIAGSVGQAMPAEVYLVGDVNAFVTQRGGVMGIGSRRVMGIGLPLVRLLTVPELRSVLVHEFGHFHGGDTRLGPWIYKTRAAIGRTLQTLEKVQSWLHFVFRAYGTLFMRVTQAISRRQELAADRLAVASVGAAVFGDALRKVCASAPLYEAYFNGDVLPVLNADLRPDVIEGFARYLATPEVTASRADYLRVSLAQVQTGTYDTHPSLRDRLAAAGQPLEAGLEASGPPAIALLDDVATLATELLVFVTGAAQIRRFAAIDWDQVGDRVWMPIWRKQWSDLGDRAPRLLVGRLPQILGDATERRSLTRTLAPEASADVIDRARPLLLHLCGVGLALAIADDRTRIEAQPGETVRLMRDGQTIAPFQLVEQAADGGLDATALARALAGLLPADAVLGPRNGQG